MNSEVNIPLLRKAVEWAEAEAALGGRGQWNQYEWIVLPEDREAENIGDASCGTAYCIAGWTLHEVGWSDERLADAYAPTIVNTAMKELNLPNDSIGFGSRLFDSDNSIEDIRLIAEDIAGERL